MTLVNSDDVDEEREPPAPPVPQTKIKSKAVPAAEKEQPLAPVAKRPRQTPNPGITKVKAVRKAIRISMLKCIPGFNQVKAQAVVEAFPAVTLGEIMDASLEELASIGHGQSGLAVCSAFPLQRLCVMSLDNPSILFIWFHGAFLLLGAFVEVSRG